MPSDSPTIREGAENEEIFDTAVPGPLYFDEENLAEDQQENIGSSDAAAESLELEQSPLATEHVGMATKRAAEENAAEEYGHKSPVKKRLVDDLENEDRNDSFKAYLDAAKKTYYRRRNNQDKEDIEVSTQMDDGAMYLIRRMNEAKDLDKEAKELQKPALHKYKMLKEVTQWLQNKSTHQIMLDNGLYKAIRGWLEPLPDKSLPHTEIRTTLLNFLLEIDFDEESFRDSGLGKILGYLQNHPKELRANRKQAGRIIGLYSSKIFKIKNEYTPDTQIERPALMPRPAPQASINGSGAAREAVSLSQMIETSEPVREKYEGYRNDPRHRKYYHKAPAVDEEALQKSRALQSVKKDPLIKKLASFAK